MEIHHKYKIEVRWGDLDANRHIGNTAYVEYLNTARMALLTKYGHGQAYLQKHQLGPVILHEQFYYLREMHADDAPEAEILLGGYSPDFRFLKFDQFIHTERTGIACYSSLVYAWFSLSSRSIVPLPEELQYFLKQVKKSNQFTILTPEVMAQYKPKL